MKLVSVELRNVGKYKKNLISLSGNLVGIVGPNGSGKSTALSAIYYAFTGDLSRLGKSEGAVTFPRPDDHQPYVKLVLSPSGTGGDLATLTRWIPDGKLKGKRKLTYDNRTYTADEDVAAVIQGWFNMPTKSMGDFAFVAQGKLTDVIDAPPAKRAEVLQHLFSVDAAAKARESVAYAIRSIPAPPDFAVISAARARSAELEYQLLEATKQLKQIKRYPQEMVDAASTVLSDATVRASLLPTRDALLARVIGYKTAALKPADQRAKSHDAYEEVTARVQRWDEYRVRRVEYHNRTARLAGLRQIASSLTLTDPGRPPAPVDVRQLALLDALAQCSHGSDCPVCGQPADGLVDAKKAKHQADRIRKAHTTYEQANAEYQKRKREYDAAIAKRDAALAELATIPEMDPPVPPDVPEPTKEEIATITKRVQEQAALVQRIETAKKELPKLESELKDLEKRLPDEVTAEEVEFARKVLFEAKINEQEISRLGGILSSTQAALDSNYKIIATAERVERDAKMNDQWRKILEGAEAILHRDAAPAAVVRSRLQGLTDRVNTVLESLVADFCVSLDPDGNLIPHRNKRPVPRLSGGQSALLALAWRLALCPGLLCLDEPTYGLDEKRIEALRLALDAWRDHTATSQIIIVTHDNRLASAFDTLVTIS